jgi:hypothetical protein
LGFLDDQYAYNNSNFPRYALWVVYFYVTTICIFTALYIHRILKDQGRKRRLLDNLLAYWRRFSYRRVSGKLGEHFDMSYGLLSLLIIATIFIAILPFYQGYFFRELFRFGSPPLSVRCAMLISALLPICVALAGKVNIVTLLTGISYAKLNIFHRYVAYMIYALAIVHTVSLSVSFGLMLSDCMQVPHFMAPAKEGGLNELARLFRQEKREVCISINGRPLDY